MPVGLGGSRDTTTGRGTDRAGDPMTNADPTLISAPAEPVTRPGEIEWVDGKMATQFANVVNVQGTREQIELFFGTNRTWNTAQSTHVTVDLSSRMILTPFAAKRLWSVLGGVLREYETRHGVLDVES